MNTSTNAKDRGYYSLVQEGLYLDYNDLNAEFTHKNVMEYAPFAFYVVKDMAIDNKNILDHTSFLDKNKNYKHEVEHDYQHLLERYYIDKIMMSTNAEDELINQSLAYLQLQKEDNEEIRAWLAEHPLYVIDG